MRTGCSSSARQVQEKGRATILEHGAHVALDHKDPTYLDAIKTATDGKGVDVVLEMAAHVNLDKDLTLLAKYGRIVVIGNRGRVEIDPRGTMAKEAAILGMLLFNVTPQELTATHAALVAGLENRTLRPVVGREFSLADAPRAHEAVLESGALGKIVITID
ncbi:MAG: zinc-binding dehydrogenase [Vicinamibacterales bacterium]